MFLSDWDVNNVTYCIEMHGLLMYIKYAIILRPNITDHVKLAVRRCTLKWTNKMNQVTFRFSDIFGLLYIYGL